MPFNIAVIGGGITGQLVQFAVPEVKIYDWKPQPASRALTRQYGANYLWEPIEGIPCREFKVITTIDGGVPTLDRVRAYKDKIGRIGDVSGWERQFQHEMTGYDFIELPRPNILYDHRITGIDRQTQTITFAKHGSLVYDMLVSTIPLYSLLSLLDMPEPQGRLRYRPIFTRRSIRPEDAPYPVDVMYVNYLSSPDIKPYRYCDRFGERHYESIVPFDGPSYTHRLVPGKIFTHPDVPAVLNLLASFNIYTFGRYGSWSTDELVHETWKHIVRWKRTHGF